MSTPLPSSSLPRRTFANFSLLRSVLTLRCLLIPSFRFTDFGVVDPASGFDATEKVDALGEDAGKKGKTDEGLATFVVGVEGAELEICSEDNS